MVCRKHCLRTADGRSGDPRSTRVAGFSLLELLLVLVIISILASLGLGRFTGTVGRQGLPAAAQRLAADLELARQKAVALGSTRTVTFAKNTGTYTLDGLPDINRPERVYTVNLAAAPYECAIQSLDLDGAGGATLAFGVYGRPILAGGADASTARLRVVLAAGGRTVVVVVDVLTGRVHVDDA